MGKINLCPIKNKIMKCLVEKEYKAKYKKKLIHFSYFHKYENGVLPHWNVKEKANIFNDKISAKNFINKFQNIYDKNTSYKIIKK